MYINLADMMVVGVAGDGGCKCLYIYMYINYSLSYRHYLEGCCIIILYLCMILLLLLLLIHIRLPTMPFMLNIWFSYGLIFGLRSLLLGIIIDKQCWTNRFLWIFFSSSSSSLTSYFSYYVFILCLPLVTQMRKDEEDKKHNCICMSGNCGFGWDWMKMTGLEEGETEHLILSSIILTI